MRCLLRLGLLASGCAAYNGYEVGTDPSTYQEAAAYCASVGGALASIYSDADNEAARDACGYQSCWIGLRESGGDHTTHALDQTWAWPDNSTTAAYHNWALSEPDNGAAYDRRLAAMNEGYIGGAPSGLWYAVGDDKTYVPLCSVDVPTAAPTISPAPTLTPAPTSLFQCDNEMCTTDEDDDNAPDDCCATSPGCMGGSTPVIKDGHKCRAGKLLDGLGRGDVIYGDLFTCCTGFQIPTDEELTASGFAWEDHKNHNEKGGGGGDGWGMQFLIILCVLMGTCVIAAVAIVVGVSYGGCCEPAAPKPRTARASARAVELVPTAHAVEVPAATGV